MTTQKIIVDITSTSDLENAVFNALNLYTGAAKQVDIIRQTYLATLESGADFDPELFAKSVAVPALKWWNAVRFQIATELVEESDGTGNAPVWTDHPAMASAQSGFNSFRQKLARDNSGHGFAIKTKKDGDKFGQFTPEQCADGAYSSFKLVEPKAKEVKTGEETAKGKGSKRKAQGSQIVTPESGADTMAQLTGDIDHARTVLTDILEQFPQLVAEKKMQPVFDRAVKRAAKLSSAQTATDKQTSKAA